LLLKTWSLPVNQQRQQTFLVSGKPGTIPIPAAQTLPVIAAIANIYSHAFRGASIHIAKTCTSLLATRSGTSCAGLEEFVTSCPLCASNLEGGIFCRDGAGFRSSPHRKPNWRCSSQIRRQANPIQRVRVLTKSHLSPVCASLGIVKL
jgi:hypothetical protein